MFPEYIAFIWSNCQQDKLARGGAFQTLSYTVDLNCLLTQSGVQECLWWWHFCSVSVFSPLYWPVVIHVNTGFVQEFSFASVLFWGCSTKSYVSLRYGQLHLIRGCCTLQLMLRWCEKTCPCNYSVCATQLCSSPLSFISLRLTISHFHSYPSLHPSPFLLCSVFSFMLFLWAHPPRLPTPF